MSEGVEFFEAGKTYEAERDGAQAVFRCFGVTIAPEGADGAGQPLAIGWQSHSDVPGAWELVLMAQGAWAEPWVLVDGDDGNA